VKPVIDNLKAIGKLTNLETLNLSNTDFPDGKILAPLKKLKILYIHRTGTKNIPRRYGLVVITPAA
jgi:Leucine-rich repeat (LRR) protein